MPLALWPVEDLMIAGYANVLSENMLPSVVPPIFVLKSDRARVFVPPYSFRDGYLFNATELGRQELVELRDRGEITLFDDEFPARREFELWLDELGARRYESWPKTRAHLADISRVSLEEAKSCLDRGDLDKADRLASIAFSADDRKVTPLVYKAAVRRRQGRSIKVMAEIARSMVDEQHFELMISACCGEAPAVVAPARKPVASQSPMHHMACAR